MGYAVFRRDDVEFGPTRRDDGRGVVRLSDAMQNARANLWRLPAGTRGVRHLERVQEEVFVALEGDLTLLLGDPAEPVDLPQGSVVVVQPGTPMQMRNDSDADVVVLILGAPPVTGEAEYLEDVG